MTIDNKQRLNNLTDSLCRSRIHDVANGYSRGVATFPLAQDPVHDPSHAYHDFIAGWEAAMSVSHDELLSENRELHTIVIDLCRKMMVKRCDVCRGLCVDGNLDDCEACDGNGYINLPDGEAEKIVVEVLSQ